MGIDNIYIYIYVRNNIHILILTNKIGKKKQKENDERQSHCAEEFKTASQLKPIMLRNVPNNCIIRYTIRLESDFITIRFYT